MPIILSAVTPIARYYVNYYFDGAKALVDEYGAELGSEIDEILEAVGSDLRFADLKEIIDSAETVYAYLSLKLGMTTASEINGVIEAPTAKDYENVLSLIMTVTEKDGIKTYSMDAAPIIEDIYAILDWLTEHSEDSVSEFIYVLIGDMLVEYDPTITSTDALIDLIASEFYGTLLLSDAAEKLIDVLESQGLTVEDVCAIFDEFVYAAYGEEINSYEYFNEYMDQFSQITINDLLREMMEEDEVTIEDFYSEIKGMLADMIVGDIELPNGALVSEMIEYAKTMLDAVDLDHNFSFSVDANGNLINLVLDHELNVRYAFDPEEDFVTLSDIEMNIVRDDNAVVELPDELKAYYVDVNSKFDKDGNLIIEGLDPPIDYDFSISGYGDFAIDEVLTLDKEISKALGYDV